MTDLYYHLPLFQVHLMFLAFAFFWIIRSDLYGSQWIFGRLNKLSKIELDKMHKYVNVGLWGMMLTGVMLIAQRPYVLESDLFKLKMSFVVLLFINSFIIGKLMNLSIMSKFQDLLNKNKLYIIISGSVSTICWLGATISAILR
jgi:hypothetical protein